MISRITRACSSGVTTGAPPSPELPHGGSGEGRAVLKCGREIYRFGPYELDVDACLLVSEGKQVRLPPREFELLCYLVRRAGTPHTPQEIYESPNSQFVAGFVGKGAFFPVGVSSRGGKGW